MEKRDAWMALAVLVCGYLFLDFVMLSEGRASVTAFALIMCGVTIAYFIANGIKLTWKSYVWLGVVLVLAAYFGIFAEEMMRGLTLLCLMGSYIYWVAVSTGRTLDERLSIYFLGDCINQGILVPFSNFPWGGKALLLPFAKGKKSKNVMMALLGVLVILPVAVAVISLLLSADVAFNAMLAKVWDAVFLDNFGETFLKVMLSIPVFLYLFGLIYGDVKKHKTEKLTKSSLEGAAHRASFAPKVTIYTALSVLNLIYVLFFASQLSYFFSAFGGILPEDFTYADYAREGFFQLCAVAVINFVMMAAATVFTRKNEGQVAPKGLRIGVGILCGFSILLTVTAVRKMVLYVDIYGLTQLRVYTMCFMMTLLAALVIIGIRQVKKFNASRILIILALLVIFSVSYGNIDGIIAKYNIERYEAGTLKELDYFTLCNLSDATVPYIYEYYKKTDDQKAKKVIKEQLLRTWNEDYPWTEDQMCDSLKEFTWQNYKADQIRLALLKEK